MFDAEQVVEVSPSGKDQNGWRRQIIMGLGRLSRHWISSVIARYSVIGDPAIFSPKQFSWTARLEHQWRAIRAEADQVLAFKEQIPPLVTISPDHKNITDKKWKSFFLWGYGYRIEENCARCPKTAALLASVPGLESAFFSILEPGAHLTPHRGVTKAIFTSHLGLRVPEDPNKCWIRVESQRVCWQEGKMFVFDDTYEHEVRNETDEERVVLLLHVRRPVRFPGSLVSKGFLSAVRASPFIQDALKNLEDWNSRAQPQG
jgi:aspartyl/asparaginyl beta-hydroxylase (cupin superfamily)